MELFKHASYLYKPKTDHRAGWERLPRNNLTNSTISVLESTFSSDWPEIEYLPNGGFFGNASNFQTVQPTDNFQYASVMTGMVATLSRGRRAT